MWQTSQCQPSLSGRLIVRLEFVATGQILDFNDGVWYEPVLSGGQLPTRDIQREPFVSEDLTPYRGSWVAIRDGKVIASALDAVKLRDDEDVREDDWLVLVPSEANGTFIL